MTQTGVTQESVFILRRLGDVFPFAAPEYASMPGQVYWLGTLALLTMIGLALASRTLFRHRDGEISLFKWFLAGTQAALFLIPAICIGVAREVDGELLWWILSVGILICGSVMTVLFYIKDSHTIGLWAVLLAPLRICVYLTLLACFLLPAIQTWEETEKRSRVLIVIDVSPSITVISDEVSRVPGVKPKTRIGKVLDFLTDDTVKFIANLTEKNPVYLYRFGTRLDDTSDEFATGSKGWSRAEWDAWASYDFKPYALKGLSNDGRAEVEKMPAWKAGEPGVADWATAFAKATDAEVVPPNLGEEDKKILATNRALLEKRVDVARSLVLGTNVPDSLLTAVNRESSNMVQGIIVFSDGRSNLGSESTIGDLRDRASREKIPIFTIAVGEKRENIAIAITDLGAPDSTQPDEPQKIIVEVDGIGLQNQTALVRLGLYLPGRDPKKDPPTHTLEKEVTFAPGDPPHGMIEFTLDADELAKDESGKQLVEDSKKVGRVKQLRAGTWQLVAKVARDKREIFADEDHVSPTRIIQVVDKPVRILMIASGPNREYQTLRTLLVREMGEKRAEVSIYLQTEGGIAGEIVQDVPPERLLTKFPDRLDTTKKIVADTPEGKLAKWYNLDEYDLIIAFDFDWNEKDKGNQLRIADQTIKNVETWVNNLGGGFLLVAAPLHTFQFARIEDDGRLKPLLNVLPVVPDDIVVVNQRGVPRTPRRLNLKPTTEADLLKLEDDGRQDKPTAGWEKFFIGSDKPGEELNLKRGFFSFYPVKAVKPGATVLAEFVDVGDQNAAKMQPYFVVSQAGTGRTGFLGSGETYRLRSADTNYFDRFWLKLTRYLSAKREAKAARGRILLNKEFTAGGPIRLQARVLQPSGEAYAQNAINPKFKVTQFNANGDQLKILGPYELKPRLSGEKFEGYYTGQVTADAKQFPHGEFRYKATVEVPDSPGDTLDAEFLIRKSDPELDETRPDFAAMERLAGTVDEVRGKLNDAVKLQKLMGNSPDASKAKLTMKLSETEKIAIIPDCMDKKFNKQRNLGGIDDLWDDEYEPTGWIHKTAHELLLPSSSLDQKINGHLRVGTLAATPLFLLAALLIAFGQSGGLFAQFVRVGGLVLGLAAVVPFAVYAVGNFFVGWDGQPGLAGKIVEVVLAGILVLPLLACVGGLFLFWKSEMFRAQASRIGSLFIGLYGALIVYAAFSFPVAIALVVVVAFLCTEWLSRKLLRLA